VKRVPVLFLVRHAESEKNALHIMSHDHTKPYHLTARGKEQAAIARDALKDITFTRAIASRYPRAQETARIILGARDIPLEVDARIDEIDNGDLEGESLDTYRARISDRTMQAPPGGETWAQLKARMSAFLRDVRQQEGNILVVSHGHPLSVLRGIIEGKDDHWMEHTIPPVCAVFRYDLPTTNRLNH